ncbi:MAG: 50S ribosomal protein L6 [Deltaproteobacteria bacterium]|nr:50S ribosomal protein L6 [Deltaproteobacteria bacterium]
MSRIGKVPIPIPSGVKLNLEEDDGVLQVTGPKGTLEYVLSSGINLEITQENIIVKRPDDHRKNRALHGLNRSIIYNLIIGVTQGFERVLEISGVGYRSEVKGNVLILNLGYSHPIHFPLPENITARVDKQNRIIIAGCDKQKVGDTAAKVRAFRPPEPYKGKGIKFIEEKIRRKVGKSGVKA